MKNNNVKIIIVNLIVAMLAVASIITLSLGNFFALKINITIDESLASSIFGDDDSIIDELGEINLDIPIYFEIRGPLLLQSFTKDSTVLVETFLSEQVDALIPTLLGTVNTIVKIFTNALVGAVVQEAKSAITANLEDLGMSEITDEQILEQLESEYGVTQADIDDLKNDLSEMMFAQLNNDADGATDILENSQTLSSLITVFAERELEEDNGTYTQEELDAKVAEMKGELIDSYNDTMSDMSIDGDFSTESIVVWFFSEIAENDSIQSIEDVESFLNDKISGSLDSSTIDGIHLVMMILGGFLLLVIASWGYLLLKILVKFFARNKTVGMLAPKLLGWLPYIILIAVPTLIFNNIPKILSALSSRLSLDAETVENILYYVNLITLKFSALTWVSALSVLILMIIWFPYHRWRKQIKREKKGYI